MKKVVNYWILFTCAFTFPKTAKAQVNIDGEIRPRTEYRDGYKTLIKDGANPAFFTEQRSRIKLKYVSDKMDFKISLQDIRIWGAVPQVYTSDPSLTSIHEAFATYKITPKLSAGVGRRELDYDNARILGDASWSQQSRSHDLAMIIYNDSTFAIHFGAAYNQNAKTPEPTKLTSTFYTGVSNYKTMQFFWIHKNIGDYGLSFLALNNGLQAGKIDTSSVKFSQTIGIYGIKLKGKLKGNIEGYYQGGKDSANKDLSAYLLAASLTYSLDICPITLGYQLLSGTKAGDTRDHYFTPLYGTNHKFYGNMDYFYVGNPHSNAGLSDIYLSSKVNILKNTTFQGTLHQLSTAVDIKNAAGSIVSRNLGTELDFQLKVALAEKVNFELGYSQMFETNTMKIIKKLEKANVSGTQNWAYVMISFTPVFFKSENK